MICGRAYSSTPDNAEKSMQRQKDKDKQRGACAAPMRARGNSRKQRKPASKAEGGEERFKMTKAPPKKKAQDALRSFTIYLQYRWNQLYRIRATRSVGNKQLRVMASEIEKQSSRFHNRVAAAACVLDSAKKCTGPRTQRTPCSIPPFGNSRLRSGVELESGARPRDRSKFARGARLHTFSGTRAKGKIFPDSRSVLLVLKSFNA